MKTITIISVIGLMLSSIFSSCEKTDDALFINDYNIDENTNHPYADNYQQIIDDLRAAGVPGVSATVRSPEGIWSKGDGKADLKNNIDLTPLYSLRAGSMSKVFASTAILILQDEGVLSIDDKINKYIPSSITDNIENANDVIQDMGDMDFMADSFISLKMILHLRLC